MPRQWIFDELTRSSATLQVAFDTHVIAPQGRFPRQTELRNVMAVLPGRTARRIYLTATTTPSTWAAAASRRGTPAAD